MAIVTNTFQTFDAKGIREDLANVIFRVSQEETPIVSNLARRSAKATLTEWQVDSLGAAVSTNQVLRGDDITSFDAITPTVPTSSTLIGKAPSPQHRFVR